MELSTGLFSVRNSFTWPNYFTSVLIRVWHNHYSLYGHYIILYNHSTNFIQYLNSFRRLNLVPKYQHFPSLSSWRLQRTSDRQLGDETVLEIGMVNHYLSSSTSLFSRHDWQQNRALRLLSGVTQRADHSPAGLQSLCSVLQDTGWTCQCFCGVLLAYAVVQNT